MKSIAIVDQVSSESFTFYDNAGGTILRSFEGFEYAEVRHSIEEVAGERSAVYVTSKFGKRLVSWEGDLVSNDVFTLRRQLLSVLRQRGEMKLIKFTTYDDLDLQFEAEVIRVANPYTHKIHSFLIEVIAPDWRFYSQTEHEEEVADGATEEIENAGNERTDPVIRIEGPGTSFTILNGTTGKGFTITNTLLEGEYIDIDVKEKTIINDSEESVYADFSGDFPSLEPGTNEVDFSAVGGGAATKIKVIYRDAYNGL
jgi:phage-related protein